MEERNINWGQIIITALVTGVVTIITGMILFRFQTRDPKLIYETSVTSPFQGSDQNFAIYDVSVSNRGLASIENVMAIIEVSTSTFEDYRISADPSLQINEVLIPGALNVQIPEFNPQDSINISVLATSDHELPTKPDISVRGSGIIGEESTIDNDTSLFDRERFSLLATAITAAYSGLVALLLMRGRGYIISILGTELTLTSKQRGDQNEILAYLCGLHGLIDDMHEYLARPRKTSYWAEADRHAAIAETDPSSAESEARKLVLINVLEYAGIAPLSRRIIQFDIARIAFAQGHQDEANEFLSRVKKNPIIKSRLRLHTELAQLIEDNK